MHRQLNNLSSIHAQQRFPHSSPYCVQYPRTIPLRNMVALRSHVLSHANPKMPLGLSCVKKKSPPAAALCWTKKKTIGDHQQIRLVTNPQSVPKRAVVTSNHSKIWWVRLDKAETITPSCCSYLQTFREAFSPRQLAA